MTATLPCGLCKQPIRLKKERWARRRVGGRWTQVCEPCANALDAQKTIEIEEAS